MSGQKRERKASQHYGTKRKERGDTLTALRHTIHEYNPSFDDKEFRKLKEALSWSESYTRELKVKGRVHKFSDPFAILKYLAEARADNDTLFASVLYPTVYESIDGLSTITKTFGINTGNIIRRTLHMEAIRPPSIGEDAPEEEKQDHLRKLQIMGMYAAQEPRPILIRAADRFVKLRKFIAAGKQITNPEDRVFLDESISVIAPMIYRVGFGKVRQDLLDVAYRLRDPAAYEEAHHSVERLDDGTIVTATNLRETERIVTRFIQQNTGLRADQFTVNARMKSPASSEDKSKKKNIPIQHLGDKFGFRVVINANTGGHHAFSIHNLSPKERNEYLHRLGNIDLDIGQRISRQYGRYSRDPELREVFRKLALIDPRDPKHPMYDEFNQDARCDNYITFPKDSGYSAYQDTVGIRVSGKLILFEMQVMDEIRYDTNTYGARAGHVAYKTGIPGDVIRDWFAIAAAIVEERDIKPGRNHVCVYGDTHNIYELREGATVGEFYKTLYGRAQMPLNLQAQIENPDRFARRDGETLYGSGAFLKNGDRVLLQYG